MNRLADFVTSLVALAICLFWIVVLIKFISMAGFTPINY